jgi:hypothetical protein
MTYLRLIAAKTFVVELSFQVVGFTVLISHFYARIMNMLVNSLVTDNGGLIPILSCNGRVILLIEIFVAFLCL